MNSEQGTVGKKILPARSYYTERNAQVWVMHILGNISLDEQSS